MRDGRGKLCNYIGGAGFPASEFLQEETMPDRRRVFFISDRTGITVFPPCLRYAPDEHLVIDPATMELPIIGALDDRPDDRPAGSV